MSYCINPDCSRPQNEPTDEICRNCGSRLLLRERYRATKVLGQGGFGKTFLAIDQDRLNTLCVIKQFLPQMQGTGALEKATELFYQEAVRLNELGVHPQIPDLFAFFVQDGRQYLVQEFIPGMNLQKILDRHGKFREAEIWAVLRDILPILDFVHQHQVIHRDIKPDNIIRRQGDNRLYLIDFGVAKLLTSPDRVITGTSIGTSGYVPLEQMSEGKAYPASDIYSLGVTCFHLLTGISPYSLFLKRGYSWLQSWQSYLDKGISPKLIQVLDRMMQENRHDRYHSAAEAIADIERVGAKDTQLRAATAEDEEYISNFLKEIVITAPRKKGDDDIIEDFFEGITKEKTEILPAAEADLDNLFEEIIENLDKDATPTNVTKGKDRNSSSNADADDEFITAFIQDITDSLVEQPLTSIEDLPTVSSYSQEQETICQVWRCERTISTHAQGCSYVGITPKEIVVTAGQRRIVQLWDIETGLSRGMVIKEDTCSTCGGLGKVFKESSVFFAKIKQATTCPDCEGFGTNSEKGERFLAAKLSRDGTTVVTSTLDKLLKFWSVNTCKFVDALSTEPSVVSFVALNQNGKIVGYVVQNRTIVVYDRDQNTELGRLKLNGLVTCLDMNSEGKILVMGTEEGTINLWDVSSGLPPLNVKGHHSGVNVVALSGDGMTVVSGCRDGMVKVWNLSTGSLVHTFKQHLTAITAIAIGSDNLTLATGGNDGVLCIWHLVTGQLLETFPAHTDRITAIAAGPDGQTFASSSLDGTVKIWRSF